MQAVEKRYRGLTLLVDINWDRLLYLAMLAASLLVGAYFGSLMLAQQF